MSAGVELSPLRPELRAAVLALRVAPGQERYSGTPALTVPAADREPGREHVVILRDGAPVGYFQLDTAGVPGAPKAPEILGLRGFLIDISVQGQGVATAALARLAPYVRERFPDHRTVALTVNLTNPAAIAVYRRAGFVETGAIYHGGTAGPQHVMLLAVDGDAPSVSSGTLSRRR
jgi:RimJ/RimL family protein N-acetyltransferase